MNFETELNTIKSENNGTKSSLDVAENSKMYFKITVGCAKNDVLQCLSVKRIKIILNTFNKTQSNKQQNNQNIMNWIKIIFTQNEYNNTNLLDDFYHIKYEHQIDGDDSEFAKVHNYLLVSQCNINTCKHFERYHRDRTKLSNQYYLNSEHTNNGSNAPYTLELISRIHVYFLHSYDTNRLKLKEIKTINKLLYQIHYKKKQNNFIN
eukprot:6570_1